MKTRRFHLSRRRARVLAAGAAMLLLVLAPRSSRAQEPPPLGPFHVQERNPLYRLFLTPAVQGADLVEVGHLRADLSASYSNIFEQGSSPSHSVLFDVERLAMALTLRYAASERFEFGLRVGTQTNWSGFLDPFIQSLHNLFGLPNADREKTSNGGYGVYVEDLATLGLLMNVPTGTLMEDPRAQVAFQLLGGKGARSALAVRASAKLPLGAPAASSGRTDVGLDLIGRRSWGRSHLHASAGVVVLGAPAELDPFLRKAALVVSAAYERRITGRLAAIAQLVGGTGYGHGFRTADLDGVPLNLVLGLAGEMSGTWQWQASFAEDALPFGPSADFTLDLELSRTW